MKRLLMVVSAFFLLGSTANAAVFDFEDHWYEVVTQDTALTWDTARDEAVEMGGSLVAITSVDENTFVADLVANQELNHSDYWLGGYQETTTIGAVNGWAWANGEAWDTSLDLWEEGEPNDGSTGGQSYLHFWRDAGEWDDMHNGTNMKGYVVEYTSNPVPVPPTLVLLGCGLLGCVGVRRRIN